MPGLNDPGGNRLLQICIPPLEPLMLHHRNDECYRGRRKASRDSSHFEINSRSWQMNILSSGVKCGKRSSIPQPAPSIDL